MARIVAERDDLLPVLAEVFRSCGFEGATLSRIGAATGLGKGSLYHFFPGGKEEMLTAVLAEIDLWFERNIFEPLRHADRSGACVEKMFEAVTAYFQSGRRVCLVGALALGETRDRFADPLKRYFRRWVEDLAHALRRSGHSRARAAYLAEEIVFGIQGAIVLSRALDDDAVFRRAIRLYRERALSKEREAGQPGSGADSSL